jgi:hypothetical protein
MALIAALQAVAFLHRCVALRHRIIVRWPHRQYLIDEKGQTRQAWPIARGKRAWGTRKIGHAHRQRHRQTSLLAFALHHPDCAVPRWLVVSRQGKGRRPWYLLTTQEVRTEEQAWPIVFADARRWDSEGTWRLDKSELGFECPRLRQWEHWRKWLVLATLASVFLLTLLRQEKQRVRSWLL